MMSAWNNEKKHDLTDNLKDTSTKLPIAGLRDGSQGIYTKERLLSVATQLLITQGYHGTTIRDIAEQCGISKSALYFYYESKDALIKDLVDLAFDHFKNDFIPIARCKYLSQRTRVKKFVEVLKEFLTQQNNTHFIFLTSLDLIHAKKAFKQRINDYMNLWLSLLQEILEPLTTDVNTSSKRLLSSLQGAIFSAYIYQDNSYLDQICADIAVFSSASI